MAMRGLPEVEQMRSVTKFGLSIVTIVFKDNVDIYFARQLVFERLAEAQEKVPKGVEVAMGPIATAMGRSISTPLKGKCRMIRSRRCLPDQSENHSGMDCHPAAEKRCRSE